MQIEIDDAAEQLEELADRAVMGEPLILTRNGVPVARIVAPKDRAENP